MLDPSKIELFVLKAVILKRAADDFNRRHSQQHSSVQLRNSESLSKYVKQFDADNQRNASEMSKHYEVFYMLENDIRRIISETLTAAHSPNWWEACVPQNVREEAKRNRKREEEAAITPRSDAEIDYITFGQLSDIIKENWSDFAGMLSNPAAVTRVLASLNMLRGTIAHCGLLAEDEVDRLELAIKDWFRVLAGPQ